MILISPNLYISADLHDVFVIHMSPLSDESEKIITEIRAAMAASAFRDGVGKRLAIHGPTSFAEFDFPASGKTDFTSPYPVNPGEPDEVSHG